MHAEVGSVLTLTCVVWVCAAVEQRLPKTQQECGYSSHLAALEIPFPLSCLLWTGWLILGTLGDEQGRCATSEHILPAFPWLRALTRGISLHRDTPNQAVNVLFPVWALGAGPKPHHTEV